MPLIKIKSSPKKVRRLTRIKEISCEHFNEIEYRYSGLGFRIYLCPECFGALLKITRDIVGRISTEDKLDDDFLETVKDVGFYCMRCEKHKFTSFKVVLTYKVKSYWRRYKDEESGEIQRVSVDSISKTPTRNIFCEKCWIEMEESRGIMLTTRRNIYLPPEFDDRIVKSFFGDRLMKTNKEFVLIPTQLLKNVVNALPDRYKNDVLKMLPGEIQGEQE